MAPPKTKPKPETKPKTKPKPNPKKDITKTDAWNAADWEYSGIIADGMMPLFGEPLSGQERIDAMMEILDACPEYYPAMFDVGQNYMIMGDDTEAGKWFSKAFKIVKEYFTEKDLIMAYDKTCEFLKSLFRYEMARDYYKILSELETKNKEKAAAYDNMAYCCVMLGQADKAVTIQQKAVELDKSNKRYGNLGWLLMVKGDLERAEEALKKAVSLDKKDNYAKNNLGACRLMRKEGLKTWNDYLLRKPDYDYLSKLEEKELFDKAEEYVINNNAGKLEAFRSELLKNPKYTLSEKHDVYLTLGYVLKFIYDLNEDSLFLYDNDAIVELFFKRIMHKFIFKTGDIDEKIFNGAYTGLLEFYLFLRKNKIISASEYKTLKNTMMKLKPELMEKMLKYNKVRHSDEYDEDEKEEIRDELFEGDHEWMFF